MCEEEEEEELSLARAAKILVSHGLLHITNGVARITHPLIGELTCVALENEGRQAQILDLAFTLERTKFNNK